MDSQLFGFLPVLPLPDSFALLYPGIVTIHVFVSCFGVAIFFFSCAFIVPLFLYVTCSKKQNPKEALYYVIVSFLLALAFSVSGVYVFFFVPVIIAEIGRRQSR